MHLISQTALQIRLTSSHHELIAASYLAIRSAFHPTVSRLQPFNETVNVCHTPVVRQCGDEPVGPEICSTHYETNCETRYKTYEIEQDEPVCTMELMKKCNNITRE